MRVFPPCMPVRPQASWEGEHPKTKSWNPQLEWPFKHVTCTPAGASLHEQIELDETGKLEH